MMTKRQVAAAMAKVGVVGMVKGKGQEWEVELPNDATLRSFRRMAKAIGLTYGGFRTGFGGWVLRPEYEGNGDWGDKCSRWHY